MDIEKILDFHRMVMLAAAHRPEEDETSCGPLCQHPACWASKRRQDRGLPRVKTPDTDRSVNNSELPTMSYYNMLEDYGENSKDRYPTRYGGRPAHDISSSMRNTALRSDSLAMTTVPFATPVSPDKASRASASMMGPSMKVVEVQEVFDQSDLNSRWDETFITKRVLMWVPNANRSSVNADKGKGKPALAITEKGEEGRQVPRMLVPKDLTEAMIPLTIQQQRQDTVLFDDWPVLKKRQDRCQCRSPIFQKGSYPRSPLVGIKPDVDSEGIRELLSLPRDVLVQVLDRTRDSDFVSREKIHGIIQDVLDTMREGRDMSPPRPGTLHTGDLLLQQKAPVHYTKQRNVHTTLSQQPVFQMDEEGKGAGRRKMGGGGRGAGGGDGGSSVMDSARVTDPASSARHPQPRYVVREGYSDFAKHKNPLPAISADKMVVGGSHISSNTGGGGGVGVSKDRQKIPSVSLGLPELPSGLKQTRAFVYNNRHRPDFSLVPVPTPPQSVRSSISQGSDHGTTMRVHVASLSADQRDLDVAPQAPHSHSFKARTQEEERNLLRGVSPTYSTHVPNAPAGTPATFHSPTKMLREFTAPSTALGVAGSKDGTQGPPPSREITMSPGHKICVPGVPFGTERAMSASPDEFGLSTIKETGREQAECSPVGSSRHARNLAPMATAGPGRLQFSPSPRGRAQATSPEEWPQVTEPAVEAAGGIMGSRSETSFIPDHRPINSRGSDRGGNSNTTLARRILDEGGKGGESPAPPPPSPEPPGGEKSGGRSGGGGGSKRVESKSRESGGGAMEPLLEQNESESGSVSLEKRSQADRTSNSGGQGQGQAERPPTQGQAMEPAIQEEAAPTHTTTTITVAGPDLPQPPSFSSVEGVDPVSKVTVSHVAPRPSASREKLQQTFMNVDIPAEDLSSLHAEQGSTPLSDLTPSVSPVKNSPTKLSTPKSSAGPSSPSRKTPPGSSAGKKSKGGKPRSGSGKRKGSGGQIEPKAGSI